MLRRDNLSRYIKLMDEVQAYGRRFSAELIAVSSNTELNTTSHSIRNTSTQIFGKVGAFGGGQNVSQWTSLNCKCTLLGKRMDYRCVCVCMCVGTPHWSQRSLSSVWRHPGWLIHDGVMSITSVSRTQCPRASKFMSYFPQWWSSCWNYTHRSVVKTYAITSFIPPRMPPTKRETITW